MSGPATTVVVVSWNTRELLSRCLTSLAGDVEAGRCRVCVVDNASEDGSAAMVAERYPWAELIASAENLGFGPAVNLAAARVKTPWLAIANADVALTPGALEALVERAASEPRAGAVAPRLIQPDGATQHSVHAFPTLAQALVIASGIGRLVRPLGRRALLLGLFDADRAQPVPWALGAFLLVRREAWDALGGFDERQWMYAEDLDLGWRLAQAGWVTFYEPRARVLHESAAATEQAWGERNVEQWQRSTYAWMLRRRGRLRTRAFAFVQIAGQLARLMFLVPAARVAPGRFARRRDVVAWWIRMHRMGLAPARKLSAHR